MRHRKRGKRDDRCARMRDDGKARGKKGRGLRSEVRCQKAEIREKGIEIRRRRSVVRPKGPEGRDPRLNSLRSIFSIYLTGQARAREEIGARLNSLRFFLAEISHKRIQKNAFYLGRNRGPQRNQDSFSILGIQKARQKRIRGYQGRQN